jgi:outer membrane protein assembly factor BamB
MRWSVGLISLLVLGWRDHVGQPACAAPAEAPAARPGSDWPCFLGPAGTSVSPEKGILAPWPKDGLRIVWQTELGGGYGAPTVSGGRLFIFDRQGDQARLRCLKAESGQPLWTFEYPTDYEDMYGYNNGPRCCPVVDGDRVYLFGAEGMLHCLRVEDHKVLWKVDTKADFNVVQNFFGVGSTPVIEGGLLITQVGGSPKGTDPRISPRTKGDQSGVVAFDKLTGKVRYRITDELASYAVPVLATIGGRRWCFVFARGGLIGFDPASGKVDFHFPWRARDLESVNASNPIIVGDQVFITETYGPGSALLRVKPGGYEVLWSDADKRDKSMQCHWNTPIYHAGYVYGCSGRHMENADLRCIELATGKVKWSQPLLSRDPPMIMGRSSLLMVDGHFLCLGETSQLLLLKVNPEKLEEVSRLVLRNGDRPLLFPPCWAAPVLSHGLLYLRGADKPGSNHGRLVCVELIR